MDAMAQSQALVPDTVPQTLLTALRTQSTVACDTLDSSVAAALGPFQECTSNQAIALAELKALTNDNYVGQIFEVVQRVRRRFEGPFGGVGQHGEGVEALLARTGGSAGKKGGRAAPSGPEAWRDRASADSETTLGGSSGSGQSAPGSGSAGYFDDVEGVVGVDVGELSVQVAMVMLALRIAPYVIASIHVQANPLHAYSASKTVADGLRLVELFRDLGKATPNAPAFDVARLVIKVPATWEGLQACRSLELRGVRTLATTLFTLEQAQLAGEMGCAYIAPYVNELKVHFEAGYQDPSPNIDLPAQAQRYYQAHDFATVVMPASLVSADQCMQMAGISHVTISPPLLCELAATPTPSTVSDPLAAGDITIDSTMLDPVADDLMNGDSFDTMGLETDVGKDPFSFWTEENSASSAGQPGQFVFSDSTWNASSIQNVHDKSPVLERVRSAAPRKNWTSNESGWRLAMTRSGDGRNESKLAQAISIFCKKQLDMEKLLLNGFTERSIPTVHAIFDEHSKYITRNVWLPRNRFQQQQDPSANNIAEN